MNLTIRKTQETEFKTTERLTKEAFADRSRLPGDICDEHFILHNLRAGGDYIPDLDYVAEDETGAIVGHILWSHASIEEADGTRHPAVTFGPLSVPPPMQNKGIGSALVRHTLPEAKRLGFTRVVLMGHPEYYPRFGFERAAGYGITAGDGNSYDACMVLALAPGAFTGVSGRVIESEAFEPDAAALAWFNKMF